MSTLARRIERLEHDREHIEQQGSEADTTAAGEGTADSDERPWYTWRSLDHHEKVVVSHLHRLASGDAGAVPWHACRCPHHVIDAARTAAPERRAELRGTVRDVRDLVIRLCDEAGVPAAPAALFSWLGGLREHRDYCPGAEYLLWPSACAADTLARADDIRCSLLDASLPPCPVCDDTGATLADDPLHAAIAALDDAQRAYVQAVGVLFMFVLPDDVPTLSDTVAWIDGSVPVPPAFEALVTDAAVFVD